MSLIKALRSLDQLHRSRMVGAMRERRCAQQALIDHDARIEETRRENAALQARRAQGWENRPVDMRRSALFRWMEQDAAWRQQQLDGEQALLALYDEREERVEDIVQAQGRIKQAMHKQQSMAQLIRRERHKQLQRQGIAEDNEIEEQVYANR